jgi:bifunctional DNA-binding transcriptional regulator/antitoxin component of YhaV-PrlF toxin-antitoxin module
MMPPVYRERHEKVYPWADFPIGMLAGKVISPYLMESKLEVAMSQLTVTAKGQVTLRKDVLQHLGVQPGEKISVDKLPNGRIEVKAVRPTGKISDAFGIIKPKNGRVLTIEEMNEIIADGWAGKR